MRLSQLIHDLNELHAQLGNVEVICSADDEGNNYGLVDGAFATDYVKNEVYVGKAVEIQANWRIDVKGIHEDDVEAYKP